VCLFVAFGQAADTPAAQASAKGIWNGATRLETVQRDARVVGVALKSGGQTLVRLFPAPRPRAAGNNGTIPRDVITGLPSPAGT